MKMINRILSAVLFFTIALFLNPISAIGQEAVKDAEKLLDKVSKTYKSYNSIQAEFEMHFKAPEEDIEDTQKGKVFLKGDKYKLELQGQEVICDNSTIWTYLKEAEEVTINTYEPDEESITPNQLFTIYEKDFIYRISEKVNEGGKTLTVVELTPNDKTKSYFKIKLFIDDSVYQIQKAKVFDKNGNRYTYTLSNINTKTGLEDSFFSFDASKYPDVEVVDLR